MKAERIYGFDLIRIFAALAVLVFHFAGHFENLYRYDLVPAFDFTYGEMGVDLFFVVSGLVISASLAGASTAGRFALARFIRLWPAYGIACVMTWFSLSLIPGAVQKAPGIKELLLNVSFLAPLFKANHIDGVYWSLYVEVQFYVLVYCLILMRRSHWLGRALVVLVGTCFVYQIGLRLIGADNFLHYYLGLMRHSHLFLTGYFLFSWKKRSMLQLALVWALCMSCVASSHWMRGYGFGVIEHLVGYNVIIFIVVFMADFKIAKFSRFCVFLGDLSYPIYLLHMMLGFAFANYMVDLGWSILSAFSGSIVYVLAISSAFLLWVDRPARAYLTHRFLKRNPLSINELQPVVSVVPINVPLGNRVE